MTDSANTWLYVVGGRLRGRTLAMVERLPLGPESPGGGEWESCANLLDSRGSHIALARPGRVYALAGGGVKSNLSSCEAMAVYPTDTTAAQWEKGCPSLPTASHALAGTVDGEGRLCVAGGWAYGSVSVEQVAMWDPQDPTVSEWTVLPSLLQPRRLHAMAAIGCDLYVFGGAINHTGTHNTATGEVLRHGATHWDPLPDMPFPGCAGAAAVGNRIFVFVFGQGVVEYNPDTRTYTRRGPLPLPGWFGFAVAGTCAGDMYLVGGTVGGNGWTKAVWRFRAGTGEWREMAQMRHARRRCAAVVVAAQ